MHHGFFTVKSKALHFMQVPDLLISHIHYSLIYVSDASLTIFAPYTHLAVIHCVCSAELSDPTRSIPEQRPLLKIPVVTFLTPPLAFSCIYAVA